MIFARLLRKPAPTPKEIAEEITSVLQRNEESRIYCWWRQHQKFPPSKRKAPDG
jgi:hypothetical protein